MRDRVLWDKRNGGFGYMPENCQTGVRGDSVEARAFQTWLSSAPVLPYMQRREAGHSMAGEL